MRFFESKEPVTKAVFGWVITITLLGSLVLGGIGGFIGGSIVGGMPQLVVSTNSENVALGVPAPQLSQQITPPSESIADVVERVSPAVASILVKVDQMTYDQSVDSYAPFGDNSPFRVETPQLKEKGVERQTVGSGSGFFVSTDGYLVTNRHVVSREDAFYTVITTDGTEHEATVLDRDPVNDLAVLKVDGTFPALSFGNSEDIKIGEQAIAIGYALGEFNNSVSVGVISGLRRNIQAGGGGEIEALENLIQTDAAINPGNSGGPLLNTKGKVIGVNVAVAQGQGIGFAIPINAVKPVVDSVKQYGRIVRPQLGVRYMLVTKEVATQNGLSVDYGALIVGSNDAPAVLQGSPAETAGLLENDVLLEVDNMRIDKDHSLASLIVKHAVGDTVMLKVLRNGVEMQVSAVLQEWGRATE